MSYLYIGLSLLLGASISAFCIPQIIVIAHKKRLFDNPEYRKIHSKVIPRLGGIAFFISILLTVAVAAGIFIYLEESGSIELPFLAGLCSLVILCFIGIADDLIGLNYKTKFTAQFITAVLTVSSGLKINNIHGLFQIHTLPEWIAVPTSILVFIFIINTINLIDGIDGLAAGLCGLAFAIIGILFFIRQQSLYAAVSFAALGMLIPFLYYNVFAKGKYRLFMGDSGSLILGYLIISLLVKLSTVDDSPYSITNPHNFIIGASPILIPAFDVIRVMLCRAKNQTHIFKPDKNHIHHKFLSAGFSSIKTLSLILFAAIGITIINFVLVSRTNVSIIIIIDILLYTALNLGLSMKIKQKKYDPSKI